MKPDLPIRSGERVLWSGQPDPAITFTAGDGFLIPFGVVFTAFSIIWIVAASSVGVLPIIFGGIFVLVGLYFLIGRFFVKAWRKSQTAYAITDKRAISVIGNSTREMTLPAVAMTTTRSPDGRHMTVDFEVPAGGTNFSFNAMASRIYRNSGMDFFDRSSVGTVSFFDVADVTGLTSALDQAQAPASVGRLE